MNCVRCGSEVVDDADFCARCGAPQTRSASPATGAAPLGHPGAGATTAYRFDARRWSTIDRIAGAATLIVLISLFLPWYSVNTAGLTSLGAGGGVVTESGTDAHGWLWFVFIIGLAVLLYLLVTVGYQALAAKLPLNHERLLLAATGLDLLLVLIAFLLKPGNDGFAEVKIGWSFGAVIALIAAIVAVVPLARSAINEMNAGRVPQHRV